MRNYIIYFLTSLFLLFVVESRLNVKTLRNDYSGHVSHHLPKRANRLNQTFEKLSIQQIADTIDNSSLELVENDFQLSDIMQTIAVFAGVFNLIYIFGLKSYKRFRQNIHGFVFGLATKRFILIRSLRI
ncbi:hypothetical protein EGY07_16435 [Chryseobacterium indologenes]|uniref:Uncharacterized protein n=1 Tax=Chryseobacterium indologenes TaxID=253 RepID=A0A1Z3W8G2_CHRID|nr:MULTISPECIES: hypothetical protein [Chryseobacterium]ASE64055.1 hypothetical protein CEQ15_22605 [Chryseobacterium indologenes]ATN04134.1 hypothetical protein CRN76_01195 [Chryseobacterium indologenes]AYY83201.1 hypothetical protein EGX91_00705 [Chryseobacterium indologenes]AYZ37028.1 hypothetical protein EGY07_16435 [Chryseobacterium indologenes]AZB19844.1 hypothetical protein EG352_19785 [Chryseobacterium indologenes]